MGSLGCDLLLVTVLLVSVGELWAQAPGDEDDRCTVNHSNPPQYPDNVTNLMDSYNYENLLPGNGTGNSPIATAVWNDFSFDGNDVTNTLSPTYWQQGAGGICRFQTRVCGWRQNGVIVSQNNWLFTQHISSDFDSNIYNYDVTIHVEAIYSLQSCRLRQGCIQRFNLLHYMTNSQQLPSTSGNGYMNTQNYENFAVPEGPVSSVTYTNTYSFTLPPSSTGFYIAVQDIGSCIALSRLRVYRSKCNSRHVGLVEYGDAPPPASSDLISPVVPVSCVPNSFIRNDSGLTNSTVDSVTCNSNGTWGPEIPQCECDCGYEESPTTDPSGFTCTACRPGYYKSEGVEECMACPQNSHSTTEGSCGCDCDDFFWRHEPENETIPCTTSPSKPQNVRGEPTNTTLTVSWDLPGSDGGRTDLYFSLSICLVASSTNDSQVSEMSFAGHNKIADCQEESQLQYIKVVGMSYTFTDLSPVTLYGIVLQSENGVSHKDDRVHLRRVEMNMPTEEGEPEEVSNPATVNNVVLVWGPPRVPNGEITGYQIRLRFSPVYVGGIGGGNEAESGAGNETASLEPAVKEEDLCANVPDYYDEVGPHTLYFVLDSSVLPNCSHNLTFSIRGKTGEDRYGMWSADQTIVPEFVCPSIPRCEECPSLDCDAVSSPTSVIAPTQTYIDTSLTTETTGPTATTSPTTDKPSASTEDPSVGTGQERSRSDLERCAYHMAGSAVAFSLIVGLLSCGFSCAIACVCHKHKMKTYKIRVKKHLQSKWDY